MTEEGTGRDDYIIARALYLAIKYIDSLPLEEREVSDQADMRQILNKRFTKLEADWIAVDMNRPLE